MSIKYVHTNIVALNWKKLVAFYQTVFECQPMLPERDISGEHLDRAVNMKDANIKGIHLALPGYGSNGPTLEIFQYNRVSDHPSKNINTLGFAHIAFSVDNVETMIDKLLQHGGSLVGEMVTIPVAGKGTVTIVYAKDPEENIVELQKWELDRT
jgi:lactoylglutathione lyase